MATAVVSCTAATATAAGMAPVSVLDRMMGAGADATANVNVDMATTSTLTSAMTSTLSIQDRLDSLRKQLKAWERDFAAANAGRKAGREDIKADVVFGMSTSQVFLSLEGRLT